MDSIRASLDVVYTTRGDRELKCDIFRPATADKLPAIVIVHGGGWINGDKTRFRALAQAMATRGYVTASIEYRLAGEALFPAAIHDCFSAVRFLRKKAVDWNIDSNRIGAVDTDIKCLVVVDVRIHVVLGVDTKLFLAGRVVH